MKNKTGLFFSIIIIICILLAQACEPLPVYRKDNKDLYSVAIHSVLGASGYQLDEIVVLEEDEYGRKLFAAHLFRVAPLGVFVSQKTDNQFAYYYEDVNYLLKDTYPAMSKEEILKVISLDEIESLKERNDWGKEQSTRECIKVPIKGEKRYLEKKIPHKTIKNVGKQNFYNMIYEEPLCEDSFGHIIWYMEGIVNKGDSEHRIFVFFFNADGTLKGDDAIMEINDIWDYSEQMIAFKEANHWNKEA